MTSTALATTDKKTIMQRYENAIATAKRIRETSREQIGQVVHSAETQFAAGAMGVIDGRFAKPKVLGIPASLLIGLALHTAGFAGFGGDRDRDLHALADGALAGYSYSLGVDVGTRMRSRGTSAPAAGSAASGAEASLVDLIRAATDG